MYADSRGSVYISGSRSNLPNYHSCITIKYDSSGSEQWNQIYSFEYGDCDPGYIVVDRDFNVIVTGGSTNSNYPGHFDILTVKYSQLIGIKRDSSFVPKMFRLYQNYPNPFNPVTRIKFDIGMIPLSRGVPEGRGVLTSLRVYDILGREIETLVNEQLKPGTYEVEWDASNFSSGIYFYRIKTGNFTETKRMILLK
jgi:hypothetical protein